MDYSYIFDLLDILGQKTLGFSIAISNNEKRTTENVFEHFQSFIPLLKRFFKDCLEKEVIPYGDCNSIPYCMLDEEYKILLIKLAQKAKKMDIKTNPHNSSVTCRPHVNILPDLTAVRCFSLSSYKKVSINDFKTLNSLENYFYNSIDIYSNLSYLRKECVECKHRLIGRCGVCFAYKLNQIERIRETVNQVNTSFYE